MKGKIIDLSHKIKHQTPVFPMDPAVGFMKHHEFHRVGYNVTQVVMGTHTGTHIDVPLHMIDGGDSVDKISLGKFIGEAVVLDLSYIRPKQEITVKDMLEYKRDIKSCRKILFRTDWSLHFGKEDFFSDFPYFSIGTARWISEQDIDLIGIEQPSVHPSEFKVIHQYFLKKGIIIVESLNNLRSLKSKYIFFSAVPLLLKGLDGSPVRAYAIES